MTLNYLCSLYAFFATALPSVLFSVEFSSLRTSNGVHICATRTPINTITTQAVSLIQCSQQCAQGKWCNFFNYFESSNKCEKFSESPFSNYTVGSKCVCYRIKRHLPQDCYDIQNYYGSTSSGVYTIFVGGDIMEDLEVYCDMVTAGGGWLVFQRRLNGSLDFFRNYQNYSIGFGNISDEFWFGNDKLHRLPVQKGYKMRFDMADFAGQVRYAEYTNFMVDSSTNFYRLTCSGYAGNAGDAMTNVSNGQYFSAFDKDKDSNSGNCASRFSGAWWYGSCHNTNPNGLYLRGSHTSYANKIEWVPWHGYYYSLKFIEIKIRPV